MAYNSKNSLLRAKRLQSLCDSENLSALVFLLGIDSKRNRLDEQVYYWLFHGLSGTENLSSISLPLSEEEIAWIVTPTSFHIYIGSALNNVKDTRSIYTQIHQISLSWPGVHLTTVTKEEIQDSELAENTKVLWFNRTMSQILGPVGVCSSEIETWPLVQGYAIDIFGLGFFSMTHPPQNVSTKISALFWEFDDAGILSVLYEHLPRLANVFQQTIDYVNKRNYSAGRGELTEQLIADCVLLPFEYATIQSTKQHNITPYFKLFGSDASNKLHSAHHMNLLAVCGLSGIFCARTWFLIPQTGFKSLLSQTEESDLLGLMQVYRVVVKAVRQSLQSVCSIEEAKEKILFEIFKSKTLFKYHHMLEAIRKARIDFYSHDADGKTIDYNPDLPIHTVMFKASNITSVDFGNLGDIVFAESYVNRAGHITILTENIQDLVVWESQTRRPWQSAYGEKLSTIENAQLFIEEFGTFQGTLLIYETGWAFRNIHIGQLEFNIEEFSKIEEHSSELLSFYTDTSRLIINLPSRSSFVLVSIWKIQESDSEIPLLPNAKPIEIPYLTPSSTANVLEDLIPIYFMTGVSGSGHTKAAKDIAKGLKLDLVSAPLPLSAFLDKSFWEKTLSSINRTSLVLLPSYQSAYDFIPFIPANCYTRAIICKVTTKNLYLSKRKNMVPALMHLIHSCNSLVLDESEPDVFADTIQAVNQSMEVFRITGAIGPAQARNILQVNKPVPEQKVYVPEFKLQSVYVNIPLPLVETKIRNRLANSEISDNGALSRRISWQHDMDIIRIKGCVQIFNKDQCFEVSGNAKYFYSAQDEETESPGILFIGRNLDLNKLYEFILDCRSHVNKIPLRSRKGLTPSEVETIEANLADNSEYIFDGTAFVDSVGKRFKVHPDLEQALLDYVDEENDRIGSINRSIEKESSVLKKANQATVINSVFAS